MSDVGRMVSGRKADVVALRSEGRDTIPAGGANTSTCRFFATIKKRRHVGMWTIMGEAWRGTEATLR